LNGDHAAVLVSIRTVEQQLHQASVTTQALYPAVVGLEKDLVAARTHIEDLESSRRKLLKTSNAVLKNLRNKDGALRGAEQRIQGIEAKLAEVVKGSHDQREAMEAKISTPISQLEAERSARSFSEGALSSARIDRQAGRSEFPSKGAWRSPAESHGRRPAPKRPQNAGRRDGSHTSAAPAGQ
jgi:chromosome segregation ATPase